MQGPFLTNSVVSMTRPMRGHVADVVRVDDAGVPEAVFVVAGLLRSPRRRRGSGRRARTASSARRARTGSDSSVSPNSSSRLARHLPARAGGQHGGVLAEEILAGHVVALVAFADLRDGRCGVSRSTSAERSAAPRRLAPWPAIMLRRRPTATTKTSFSAMQSRLLS